MRLDLKVSSENGCSRTRAQDMIKAGRVFVNGKEITKPAFEVDTCDTIDIKPAHEYVSRAGAKLESVFGACDLSISGQTVLDIGASTGGFTQCCLEHGAAKVYALDVGHLQLSPTLKADSRVVEMEGINVKSIQASMFDPVPEFVCMDVSFISAISALEPVFSQFVPEHCAILVKPQFECGPKALNKKGIIKHPKYEQKATEKVRTFLLGYFEKVRVLPSPVKGRGGNQEYLLYASRKRGSEHD